MLNYLALGALALSIIKGISILVSYIGNNAFPQPLSAAEERRYLELLQQGEESARNVLIEHNLRLVAHITKKFEGTGEDHEDLISIGTIGLIKGIDTFKPDKGTRLATYAARCIENEILMHLRFLKKSKGEVSINDPIGVDKEGNEIGLIDVLGTETDIVAETVEALQEQERVLKKLNSLTEREKDVIIMRFGLFNNFRKTQREIAKKLNISRSYVSRIEKKALEKLVKEIKKEEEL